MGGESLRMLRNLCSNTGWYYAIYWKLRQHHSQMVLTWEDAFFDDCDLSHPNKYAYGSKGYVPNAYIHDSIKSTLTATSYDVYPLGEGIIGEVAASGKHRWLFGDRQECNGWPAQFAAGIKTVAIIAAAPHGVVQLGSLYKINENMQLIDQITKSFLTLRMCSVSAGAEDILNNGGASDLLADNDCQMQLQQESDSEELGEIYSKMIDGITPQLRVNMDSEASGIPPTCNMAFPLNDTVSAFPFHDSNHGSYDRVNFDLRDQYQSQLPSSNLKYTSGLKPDMQGTLSHSESSNTSLKFSAGCELYEALGPAFSKQLSNYVKHIEAGKGQHIEYSEGMSSSSGQLASSSNSEHLLEAVVANIFNNNEDYKSKSMQSLLTTDCMPEASYDDHRNLLKDHLSSFCYPAKEESHYSSSTAEEYFSRSPTMLSSICVRSCTEPVSKSLETSKGHKKRTRPGESSKPRPRDRQLIQDRIKELRELIPSGAKCSIDSLLERTIKHMQFMQNMTEHADKLKQCAESKMQSKDVVEGSSSHEQGSSWAVEVGGHLKVCRILVENVNMNRQMLIEILCEECSHFLEIAEVVKSLGLTILKGATEACGEKTWICFLVEGQKNKSIQRLDILWSLVHVLQPKTQHEHHA